MKTLGEILVICSCVFPLYWLWPQICSLAISWVKLLESFVGNFRKYPFLKFWGPTWKLFVLYFWASTLQNNVCSNQNRGHVGSRYILPWKLTCPWKSMVGRCIPYWNSPFLGGHVSFQGCNFSSHFCCGNQYLGGNESLVSSWHEPRKNKNSDAFHEILVV